MNTCEVTKNPKSMQKGRNKACKCLALKTLWEDNSPDIMSAQLSLQDYDLKVESDVNDLKNQKAAFYFYSVQNVLIFKYLPLFWTVLALESLADNRTSRQGCSAVWSFAWDFLWELRVLAVKSWLPSTLWVSQWCLQQGIIQTQHNSFIPPKARVHFIKGKQMAVSLFNSQQNDHGL